MAVDPESALRAADLATAIGFPEHRIRLIAPDVGGGFGSKAALYQEEALACHLALQLGRPVKWIATRIEDFLTTYQGRDQVMTSELALKRDGTMLGLKVRVVGISAPTSHQRAIPPLRMMGMAPGCYQIRNCHVEVVAVLTNTVSTGPYRGAGRRRRCSTSSAWSIRQRATLASTGWTSGAKTFGRSSSRTARE